jgi:hypothetical protein
MVSTNTSTAPQTPCSKGWAVSAVACTMGAVPRPASLESIPRAMPCLIAVATATPVAPPTPAAGVNAYVTIVSRTPGIRW